MVHGKLIGSILITNREAGAVHHIWTAKPPNQASHKSCFAAAEVANQFNSFATLKSSADLLGEL